MSRLSQGVPRWTALLLLAILPAAVLSALVYALHGASILDVLPSHPDDFRNWLVVRNYQDVGFASGYFVHNEIPARWTLTPYAGDGPWYAMLFGVLARVGGWGLHSGATYNLVFLCAVLLLFGTMARMDTRGLVWAALFVSLTPLVYISALNTSYSEAYLAMGVSLTIPFGAMLARLEEGLPVGWLRAGTVAAVFAASIFKVDWALLLFPAFLLGRSGPKAWLAWGSAAVILCALSGIIMLLAGAPIGSPASTLAFWSAHNPVWAALETARALAAHNVSAYLDGVLTTGELLAQIQGLLVLLAFAIPAFRREGLPRGLAKDLAWFNVFNLGSVFVLINTLYIPYAGVGEKYITAHVFVSVLAQYRFFRREVLAALLGLSTVIFLLFLSHGERDTIGFFSSYPEARADQFAADARATFKYTPGANRWYNTVINLNGAYPPEILALPSGLGYSVMLDPKRITLPLKSRYVIDDGSPATAGILAASRLKPLLATRIGTIYENLDSQGSPGDSR